MASPSYKLTYFNLRGRGEVARYLFVLAGVPFVDRRVESGEWRELKPAMPFGQLPVLEMDGKMYCQSIGINRFLARQFGYYGSDAIQGLEIDQILGAIGDLLPKDSEMTWGLHGEEKEKAIQSFKETDVPRLLKFLESLLGDRKWLVGDNVTLADLAVFEFLTASVTRLTGDGWRQSSPVVEALTERVASLPALAAYIASRPVTSV